ncbi:6-phosphogluconate dehydrogenase [Fusarium heterosporum]|uniref:phosphogluconate dehydrogenase (NADP(+)-dependent, decarboxylating) n=1 Tax=Fusarium heterosporum TaxID=42747 RepID=A0A8H5T3J1_FUSHE|nr:6-phosphogluconate dehydrogenase [Fusarium heterosporum]
MSENNISKVGMVGVGSMGSMMSLLFAEKGCHIYYHDISENNMRAEEKLAKNVDKEDRIVREHSYKQLCEDMKSDNHSRVIVLCVPHGNPGDQCIERLRPYMSEGDIILDCSNEYYVNTEKRQADLARDGIYYVGCGMSNGYHSARAGPSMSPGGDPRALEVVMPLLRTVAAKDGDGKPRTSPIGPGGSGHYVKMIHNGIEQGMMSIISEAWYILTKGLQLSNDEAAGVFEQWNESDELHKTFLIWIAVNINKARDSQDRHVLNWIQDDVVQDTNNSEGTGAWSCEEAVRLHVPAVGILSAHLFRYTSAQLKQRIANAEASESHIQSTAIKVNSKDEFIEHLRKTTYFCLLLCFTQGLQIIREMDQQREWNINYPDLLHVWSAGSIIQTRGIMKLLKKAYGTPQAHADILSSGELAQQLAELLPSVKRSVVVAVEADLYSTAVDLPTQLTEAELDYFGNHKFDVKEKREGEPVKDKHHAA